MRKLIALLCLLASVAVARPPTAHIVRLAWDASPDNFVVNYRIHWGDASRSYTKSYLFANYTEVSLLVSDPLPIYFTVTAVSPWGLESEYSNEVVLTEWADPPVNWKPPGPRGLRFPQ
jgi:hypothetical protein